MPEQMNAMPEHLKDLWKKLVPERGTQIELDALEQYLVGKDKITPKQLEAGCHLLGKFPPSIARNAAYSPLRDYLFDALHHKYCGADDEDRAKVEWLVSTLFKACFANNYLLDFGSAIKAPLLDTTLKAYEAELHEMLDKGVHEGLAIELKEGQPLAALLQTVCQNDLKNLKRKYVGRSDVSRQANSLKRFVTQPTSLNSGGSDGEDITESVASEIREPLAELIAREEQRIDAAQRARLAKLDTAAGHRALKLTDRERQVMPYVIQQIYGVEQPPYTEIAQALKLDVRQVMTSIGTVKEKIRVYFGVASKTKRKLGTLEESFNALDEKVMHVAPYISQRNIELIQACRDLRQSGSQITASEVVRRMTKREPTESEIRAVYGDMKQIMKKVKDYEDGRQLKNAPKVDHTLKWIAKMQPEVLQSGVLNATQCDLVSCCHRLAESGAPITVKAIADIMGVSDTHIYNNIKQIRDAVQTNGKGSPVIAP